jgi:hypothetical protein
MSERKKRTPNTGEMAAVRQRIEEIGERKSRGIRWAISKHTAEMTLRALEEPNPPAHRPSSKSRRRKRYKRLL